jgi:hypothetical protein
MHRASCLSLHLVRFDSIRTAGGVETGNLPGVLFCGVAADTQAAGTEPDSQQAFVFAVLGLHATAHSAHRLLENREAFAPWMREAREVWGAILQPYRHKGEANYLDRERPGLLFSRDALATPPPPEAPFVSVTTSGWNATPELDMTRVREFYTGLLAIRSSMTAMPGLHSQQSFFFPRTIEFDPVSVAIWRDLSAMNEFAYGPGVHRLQTQLQQERRMADRTSFTRCVVFRNEGTWYGSNPLDGPVSP